MSNDHPYQGLTNLTKQATLDDGSGTRPFTNDGDRCDRENGPQAPEVWAQCLTCWLVEMDPGNGDLAWEGDDPSSGQVTLGR